MSPERPKGMAVMMLLCGIASTLAVLLFYTMPSVRNVETLVTDLDYKAESPKVDSPNDEGGAA